MGSYWNHTDTLTLRMANDWSAESSFKPRLPESLGKLGMLNVGQLVDDLICRIATANLGGLSLALEHLLMPILGHHSE